MTRHFFTSDPHFGHGNIIKYCRRTAFLDADEAARLRRGEDFRVSDQSVERMNQALVEAINQTVAPEDVLWCLGDWVFGPTNLAHDEARHWRERIACHTLHFIWGNHDRRAIAPLFSTTHDLLTIAIEPTTGEHVLGEEHIYGASRRLYEGWQKLVLCHYQMVTWHGANRGVWHLYGHSHARAEGWSDRTMPGRESLDVGVDNAFRLLGEYRPWSFEEVRDHLDARSGFHMPHQD